MIDTSSKIVEESKSQSDGSINLPQLNFVNTVLNSGLPIDENPNNTIRQVKGFVYSKVTPTPVEDPRLGCLSKPCLDLLDIDMSKILSSDESKHQFAEFLSGNKLFPNSIPISHNYCGHQFGVFAGQLGDGRAITIGDIKNQKGELWELQLKGSGQTPYSRFADGRAVLRSSIREFLCSEAMHFLRIPTSRAASLIVSDTRVQRDPVYSGKVIWEKCAIVCRVAPTFFRFGSFEVFKGLDKYSGSQGPSEGLQGQLMPKMLNFVIKNYFPEIFSKNQNDQSEMCLEFLKEVVNRSARLAALWQCYGYCHGVLNTDNMSILGLTIDYGPFAFMEHFNPDFICNYSDKEGRYSYENQPKMVKWNCNKLCEALDPFVEIEVSKKYVSDKFDEVFSSAYLGTMAHKLGFLTEVKKEEVELKDYEYQIIGEIFEIMKHCGSDFTNTFRVLSQISRSESLREQDEDTINQLMAFSAPEEALKVKKEPKYSGGMLIKIKQILEKQPELLRMFGIDPDEARKEIQQQEEGYYKVQEISSEDRLKEGRNKWVEWVMKYKQALSKMDPSITDEVRKESMDKYNPKFILRNYLMEEAIQQADKHEDFTKVEKLLDLAINPFDESSSLNEYSKIPPKWAFDLCISCSS